ncbi:MAG: bifunctional N-acetylglucosamine-1-phosphate uridyltransferase/glucosamine-1-phosphate acetyltransferase [Planctomycetes bacterium]|nr:bifunctional N-acetylglucosamine-1-phosphate uridyltransferase/glucosamine-1-phosphate acetyltransferase [Planctomycetota bacterium]
MPAPLSVIVLAAGKGTRMRSDLPKVLHAVCGRPLLRWILHAVAELHPDHVVAVLGHGREQVEVELTKWNALAQRGSAAAFSGLPAVSSVVQEPQLGTAHAVRQAEPALPRGAGRVLVLYGDTPMLTAETLRALLDAQPAEGCSFLTCEMLDPTGMGRVLRDAHGAFRGVIEHKDATPEQRAVQEINAGVYVFDAPRLWECLAAVRAENAQKEYYLTDVLGLFLARGYPIRPVLCAGGEREVQGVNSLRELAIAREELQERILTRHLANGVRITAPETAYIDADVEIGRGTVIHPCVVIQHDVKVGENCSVGPFAHLRPGTTLAEGVDVGNFVEVNRTQMAAGSKAKHLTYLGDAIIGEKANIGAGTVTANYDGKSKFTTRIGARAFIGSGAILVAPATVGDGAKLGAQAALVHKEIPAGEVWVGVPARPLAARGARPSGAAPADAGTDGRHA